MTGTRLEAKRFAALCAMGAPQRYPAGAILFRQGDPSDHVVVLVRGITKVVASSESGYETVLAIRSAGEIVGEFAAFDRRPRSASVYAITDVDSRIISGDGFRAYLRGEPELALLMIAALVGRLRESDRRRAEFGGLTVLSRVARLLLELAERHGVPDKPAGRGTTIAVTLSQQDLAGAVGASREAVARVLRQLRDRGAIATSRLRIVVLRPEILRRLGGLDPTAQLRERGTP